MQMILRTINIRDKIPNYIFLDEFRSCISGVFIYLSQTSVAYALLNVSYFHFNQQEFLEYH